METVSIWQVVMRNSGWRRRALESNCARMRLESATRTLIASGVAADDGLIDSVSKKTTKNG